MVAVARCGLEGECGLACRGGEPSRLGMHPETLRRRSASTRWTRARVRNCRPVMSARRSGGFATRTTSCAARTRSSSQRACFRQGARPRATEVGRYIDGIAAFRGRAGPSVLLSAAGVALSAAEVVVVVVSKSLPARPNPRKQRDDGLTERGARLEVHIAGPHVRIRSEPILGAEAAHGRHEDRAEAVVGHLEVVGVGRLLEP